MFVRSLPVGVRAELIESLSPLQRAALAGALLDCRTFDRAEQVAVREELVERIERRRHLRLAAAPPSSLPVDAMAALLANERPSLVAAVLYDLPSPLAASLAKRLAASHRAAALRHLATTAEPTSMARNIVRQFLDEQAQQATVEPSAGDGATRLANLLRCADPRTAAVWQAELAHDASASVGKPTG